MLAEVIGKTLEHVNDEICDEETKNHLHAMRKAKIVTAIAAPALIAVGAPVAAVYVVSVGAGLIACKLFEKKKNT